MFKSIIAATLVAAVSAASWPMVTVNSAGNIVLNSPTKAGSFQLNAVTTTAGPTSSTTASRSTVTALDADTDAFIVSVPSSPATSAGYKLPTATEGRTIRFYNSGSGKGAFTIWTASTAVFIDGTSATSIDILSTTSMVTATATSSTNWVISQNALASNGIINKAYRNAETVSLTTNAVTATAAQLAGGILTITPTAASTITTPTASSMTSFDSNSANADSYEFTVKNTATVAAGSGLVDMGLTLTAGTGFTVPTDGTQVIIPGQTTNFIAYRSTSSAWVIVTKSRFTIIQAALVTSALMANGGTVATTCHGLRCTPATLTGSATALTATTYTVTNNYAKLGDLCFVTNGAQATATTGEVANYDCQINSDNTLTIIDQHLAAAAPVDTLPVINVIKA